ncbi:hypothetical protein T10_370 [Trichinella papuae]|uniref:Uncharacterized protein n=1 Tax=Trichinella papuae TaxID=268474 RepID=A0A0V1LXJ1_9BILA|nr:hypothetical protein T10_370 [Trichinella papuae]
MPLKRYFTEYKADYDKNDNSKRIFINASESALKIKRTMHSTA